MTGNFWHDKRVIVTGGAGFLGSFVIEKLKQRGATDIFIPRIENYNLVDPNDIRRLYADTSTVLTRRTWLLFTWLQTWVGSAQTSNILQTSSMTIS